MSRPFGTYFNDYPKELATVTRDYIFSYWLNKIVEWKILGVTMECLKTNLFRITSEFIV